MSSAGVDSDERYYADLRWSAEDVQTLRPDWSLERCENWLIANEKYIRDRLCELGWDVIETLLPRESESDSDG